MKEIDPAQLVRPIYTVLVVSDYKRSLIPIIVIHAQNMHGAFGGAFMIKVDLHIHTVSTDSDPHDHHRRPNSSPFLLERLSLPLHAPLLQET